MSDLIRARLDKRPRHAAAVKECCEGLSGGSPLRRKQSADEAAEKELGSGDFMRPIPSAARRRPATAKRGRTSARRSGREAASHGKRRARGPAATIGATSAKRHRNRWCLSIM